MKRREFLAGACAAGAAGLVRAAGGAEAGAKQYLELRLCRVGSEDQKKRLCEFLAKAAVPAWGRAGVKPVGVFELIGPAPKPKGTEPAVMGPDDVWVLLPHPTAEAAATCRARLLADEQYLRDGEPFLKLPKNDPLYRRIESSLMLAFDSVPKVEVPSKADGRIFQLRIYEAHSVERNQKKIEMFNAGGEVAIFRKNGLGPVFFGEALIGLRVPNLSYMVGFDSPDAQAAGWKKFSADPDWKRISKDPVYKDTVSNITNLVLRPLACSQI